jgi:multidrug efflux pump subunit AcrB
MRTVESDGDSSAAAIAVAVMGATIVAFVLYVGIVLIISAVELDSPFLSGLLLAAPFPICGITALLIMRTAPISAPVRIGLVVAIAVVAPAIAMWVVQIVGTLWAVAR